MIPPRMIALRLSMAPFWPKMVSSIKSSELQNAIFKKKIHQHRNCLECKYREVTNVKIMTATLNDVDVDPLHKS